MKRSNDLLAKKVFLSLCAGALVFAVQNPVMAEKTNTLTITGKTIDPATFKLASVYSKYIYAINPDTKLVISSNDDLRKVTYNGSPDHSNVYFVGAFGSDANKAEVEMNKGTAFGIYGGYATAGNANYNTVTICKPETGDNKIVLQEVHGGYAEKGTASHNTLKIENVLLGEYVEEYHRNDPINFVNYEMNAGHGGISADDNTLEITNSTVYLSGINIMGGVSKGENSGNTNDNGSKNNKVIIENSTIVNSPPSQYPYIVGGESDWGIVSGNEVYLKNGVELKKIYVVIAGYGGGGEYKNNSDITKNTVWVTDCNNLDVIVIGGYNIGPGAVTNNTVNITDSTVKKNVAGGQSGDYYYTGSSLVANNTVNITNSKIVGSVYGGLGTKDTYNGNGNGNHPVKDNTINLFGSNVITGTLYGGCSFTGCEVSGNTLNVKGLNNKAGNIVGCDNINFYIPKAAINDNTMLTLTAAEDTDISAAKVKAGVEGGSSLQVGDSINLIVKDGGTLITEADGKSTTYGTLSDGVSKDYKLEIVKKDDKTLVATIKAQTEPEPEPGEGGEGGSGNQGGSDAGTKPDTDNKLNPQTKSLVETQMAGMALLNGGMDMLAGEGIANAIASSDGVGGEFSMFGQIGASNMRYNTGSHVDLDGWNIGLGFAKTVENNAGKLTFGPVISYGKGSYDSYVDDGVHGEGDSSYFGIGVFAHQANKDGLYYEGSISGGRVSNDYSSNDLEIAGAKVHEQYDTDSTFVAAHLGMGKVIDVSDKAKLDVYGKYFYAHQGGDNPKMATGETYHFDAVDSNRIRVGARYEVENNAFTTTYVGTAYEYEFSGDAKATYKGMETPSPSLKGSSGMLELGWKVKPSAASPLTIDLSANGWCGQKEGYGLKANFLWNF